MTTRGVTYFDLSQSILGMLALRLLDTSVKLIAQHSITDLEVKSTCLSSRYRAGVLLIATRGAAALI